MANNNAIGQFRDEVETTVGEVTQDVKDSVGQAIEQGVQSVVGSTLTPQQLQIKQQEDQSKLVEARRKIDYWKKIDLEQKKIRMEEKQKLSQKQQIEEQEKQQKKMAEEQKKKVIPRVGKRTGGQMSEDLARSKQELGKGHGVGG